ncbi:MAG: thioesterase [Hyphomicrobiales bacterium]|nr:MAG: thioesterase [Hyphomicrobiales bacterium]
MAAFTPLNPDYEARVRASFAKQRAMHSLGIEMTALAPGRAELAMAYDARFCQQHGFVHAGILTTALDSACGYAAFSLMPADAAVLTIELKTNLLAPGRGARFRFVGEVIKPGRTITVSEARAFAATAEGEKLIATMTATLMAVRERDDVRE